MKFCMLCLGFLLYFIFACTSNENKIKNNEINNSYYQLKTYKDSFGVKHNFTLGVDSTVLFYNITSLFPEKENTLLVLDKGVKKILRFDESGNLLEHSTDKNLASNVLKNPTFIVSVNNFILVTEQYSPKVHLFSKELTYLKSIMLKLICNDIFVNNDTIIITGATLKNSSRVKVAKFNVKNFLYKFYSYESKLPTQLKEKAKDLRVKYIWKFGSIAKYKNNVYFLYYFQNILMHFNSSAVIYKKNFKKYPRLSEVLSEEYAYLPSKKIFNDIAVNKFGDLYILVGEYCKYPNRLILKVDKKGNEIDKIVLPHESRSIYISNTGKLYSINKNKINIHSYSFTR